MNHGPIIVSENGFKAMNYSAEFAKHARERGIRDPFEVSMQLFSKRYRKEADGTHVLDIDIDPATGKVRPVAAEPTRAEKDAYIRMRDEYVAERCFAEIGYQMFLDHTLPAEESHSAYDVSYLRRLEKFVPCRAADRQCSLYCPKFADCAIDGTWKPD